MHEIRLKPNREKSLRRKHPWVFSGAIKSIDGSPKIGETVLVRSNEKAKVGYGAYSPHSSIRVRMWSFDCEKEIDNAFIENKLRIAINIRESLNLKWNLKE